MNEKLIQFIELCLMDGIITDKEREVIFRKSKELGVPDDECEIILEGMVQKHSNSERVSPPISKTSTETIEEVVIPSVEDKDENILKDGKKNGVEKVYKENGQLRSETTYVDGKKNGVQKHYFNGQLYSEKTYVDGKKNGVEKHYEENGQLSSETTYEDGKKNGVGNLYLNGQLSSETTYVDDKKNGVEKHYVDNELSSEKTYVDDEENGVRKYYLNGQLYIETTYVDDKKNGVEKVYDENGQLYTELIYENDIETKTVFSYRDNEKKKNIKEREEREEREKERKENLKNEFIGLITFDNVTNPKSKLYDLIINEEFSFNYDYLGNEIRICLYDHNGYIVNYTISSSIDSLKLIVFEKVFRSKERLLTKSSDDFFRFKRKKNISEVIKRKFPSQFITSLNDGSLYIDKNGWFFNPVKSSILFYVDDINIFEYNLEGVKSLTTLPFYKGGLFSKPGIELNKGGSRIGIKSNELFEETERNYKDWVKFLFTLNDFQKNIKSLQNEKSLNLNTNVLEEIKNYSDIILKGYLNEVKDILNSKKSEIELKEKEFNSNFIHDFIKVINFVRSSMDSYGSMNRSLVWDLESKIKNKEFLLPSQVKKLIVSQKKFISLNSSITFGLIEMIRSIIHNDRIRFYEIYEKFDKLRIFNSQHQNDVVDSLNSINKNLVDLNTKIENLTQTIESLGNELLSSINELQFEVSSLNDNVSSQLQGISSKLDVSNLLNMVQTYQLYQINKSTKSLKG